VDEKYLMRFQGETSVFKFLCIPFRPLFLTSCPILSAYVVSFYLFFFLLLLPLLEFDYEAMDFSSTDEEETGLYFF